MRSERLSGYIKSSALPHVALALLGVIAVMAGPSSFAHAQEQAPAAPAGPATAQAPDPVPTDRQLLDKALAAAKIQDDAAELQTLQTLLGRYPELQDPVRYRKLPQATQALLRRASLMSLSLQAQSDYYAKTGTRIRRVGGGVSAPVPIHQVQPELSDEARQGHFGGIAVVNLIVDEKGNPQNVHLLQAMGHGMDEKAIQAVKQYKFKPAMENGKPVPVMLNVEINIDPF